MKPRLTSRVASIMAVGTLVAATSPANADAVDPAQSFWSRGTPTADTALADPAVRYGKSVFDGHCRTCHAVAASPAALGFFPGTYALEMRYKGKLPAALEQRTDLTAERVTAVVRRGGGGFMPPLRPTELSDSDLKAVATYLSRHATASH